VLEEERTFAVNLPGEAPVGQRRARHRRAAVADLPRLGKDEAVHQFEQRRLAAAVDAKKNDLVASTHVQRQLVDDRPLVGPAKAHAVEFEHQSKAPRARIACVTLAACACALSSNATASAAAGR
jgi:hypothetical protein